MSQNVLLVEGVNDTTFYEAFCRENKLKHIQVKNPRFFGAPVDSKTHAINILPELFKQLNDGSISRLAIIVDADYEPEHGLGFKGTLDKIREQAAIPGFVTEKKLAHGGYIFEHGDGLPPFGAWIMPDNAHDGMLEDFIKASIQSKEQVKLYGQASKIVGELVAPLFKTIHRTKAEVSTWLSWQKMPGVRVENAVGNHLIDLKSAKCLALREWIKQTFF